MEILLWLAPPALVTLAAMCWAGWAARAEAGEVDRDAAVRRLQRALQNERPVRYAAPPPTRDRSTGVAVRPSRAGRTGVGGQQTGHRGAGRRAS